MYSKRLKITEPDYKRLESIITVTFNNPKLTINNYLAIAKDKKYSNTRIVFDVYHGIVFMLASINKSDYEFMRELTRRDYLNDATLESALMAILKDHPMFKESLGENQ